MGGAGTKMPDAPVGDRRCGSHRTSWLVGGHPSKDDFQKEVSRTINFQWNGKVADRSREAKVIHCGDYYVYYLTDLTACRGTYCGQ